MPTPAPAPVVRFGKDTTIRWNCEAGDLVAWVPCPSLLGSGNEFTFSDIWEMRDGDCITISNRPEDFPARFKLAPSEVSGPRVCELVEKLNSGEIKATEPVQAANVWRLPAGARLLWMGVKRPGYSTFEGAHGVLQLLDFCENALVVGESPSMGWEAFSLFGALTKQSPSAEVRATCGSARELVRQLGVPNMMAVEWSIG